MAVYAVSDIHGYADILKKGLDQIGFGESDSLYVVGDAIDRGPDGTEILRMIKDSPNMDLLIGNHEFMMLNSVDPEGSAKCNGRDSDLWLYYNGGLKTYETYRALTDDERMELLTWLRGRTLIRTLTAGDKRFCLTHSFYIEECENRIYSELDYNTVWDIVWKSMFREDTTSCPDIYAAYPELIFITGHVPVQRVRREKAEDGDYNVLCSYSYRNFYDIDGGCAFGVRSGLENGVLFMRLDDLEIIPVKMQ